jgi:hypothetical protein
MSSLPTSNSLRRCGPPSAVAAVLPKLLAGLEPEGITVLKPGAVFQLHTGQGEKDLIVKLYKRSAKLRAKLQPPGAKRAVAAYLRLLPVPSPKPVWWDRLDHAQYRSVLVYEFAVGPTLHQLWKQGDPQAMDELPEFLGALYRTGVLHGDLHGRNLVWTARQWLVLDLDSIRSGLHSLRRKQIWERTWARLLFDFEGTPEAQTLFERFATSAGLEGDIQGAWNRILRRYHVIVDAHRPYGLEPGD